MSTTTETAQQFDASTGNWRAGVLGGIGGALVMGALVLAMNAATLEVAIPSLYTLAPPASAGLGLVVHVSHGAVLGVVFAGLVGAFDLDSLGGQVGLGAAWGAVTWVVLAALVMPVWLDVVGSPANPPLPNFAIPSLLWHVVYGLVLGGVYALVEDAV
ncbi:histidine kinase [Haloarchaeobius amylolyticus]|uniref:histidine kinase n=1 Tax=Haloarchaeobius amylolyticus TaxID=1198296 RepID=UPI00226FC1EF|nr:histidine kinase [Haloarchaeobius amylolyticus]